MGFREYLIPVIYDRIVRSFFDKWLMVNGSWLMAQGLWLISQGSWLMANQKLGARARGLGDTAAIFSWP